MGMRDDFGTGTGESGVSEKAEAVRQWVHGALIYGIDISRFFDSDGDGIGDVQGVISKLDHLSELGVTCLWLLPFFPSERRDNGYDVMDYEGVDPLFGTLEDFRELTTRAHQLGMRVMNDLVVHHTSDRHPWFIAAQNDSHSRYAGYYIWSEDKPSDGVQLSVFRHEEDGIWDYSRLADKYYRHLFYSFEPDLNLASDEVWDDVKRILDFWIALGVDAFRIDAATLMFNGLDLGPSFGERFDDLRRYLDERSPHVALLGEADVRSGEAARYFENGRFDLLYGFPANNALYLSIVRECGTPLLSAISKARDDFAGGLFANFMRNLDELDLGQLTADERKEVLDVLAPEEFMRIYGRGIRRGWAPMMRSQAQLRMTMSLLFALPGTPLVMYGQEIGMGYDLALPGRDVVRLPMQWSTEVNGGFSAGSSHVTALARHGGERGYRRVNVAAQRGVAGSLLTLVRDLAEVRRRHPAVGGEEWQVIDTDDDALAVIRYGDVVTAHNFARRPVPFPRLGRLRTLLGEALDAKELPPDGFGWALKQ